MTLTSYLISLSYRGKALGPFQLTIVTKVKQTVITLPFTEARSSFSKDEPNVMPIPPEADKTK